jgi:hypothetical protein
MSMHDIVKHEGWMKVTDGVPPDIQRRYRVYVLKPSRFLKGHLLGQQHMGIVYDWAVRKFPDSFTHWAWIPKFPD